MIDMPSNLFVKSAYAWHIKPCSRGVSRKWRKQQNTEEFIEVLDVTASFSYEISAFSWWEEERYVRQHQKLKMMSAELAQDALSSLRFFILSVQEPVRPRIGSWKDRLTL